MQFNRAAAFVLALLWAGSAAAQEPATAAADGARATVVIGDTAAPPEWHLRVPVAVNLVAGAEIGALSLRLFYPARVLKYTGLRAADPLKRAGYEATARDANTSGDDGSVVLELKRTAKEPKPLPSGTLVIVEFKVEADAPQKVWPIRAEDLRAAGLGPAAAPVRVAFKGPAKVLVTPPGLPILSCFFYMH